MVYVFKKEFRKSWLIGIVPPLLVMVFVPLIAVIWPELELQAEAFEQMLENPLYAAMLGDLLETGFTTWEGAYFLYIFIWSEWVILFITIVVPAFLISSEIDRKTLDVMLSYPIPRWRFALEKFAVYATYNLFYPIFIVLITFISTEYLQEQFNYEVLMYALIGLWLWLFTLGALSFLCAAIFLETRKSISFAALLIMGQYILQRFGGLSETLEFYQNISIFNYLSAGKIYKWFINPETYNFFEEFIPQVLLVTGIGIAALIAALFIFQHRELAY